MPKARKNKSTVIEERKWIVSFKERQAFLTCPQCGYTINFDIVRRPQTCKKCGTKLCGIRGNQ